MIEDLSILIWEIRTFFSGSRFNLTATMIIISHLFNSLVTTHWNPEGTCVQNKVKIIKMKHKKTTIMGIDRKTFYLMKTFIN